MADFLPSIDPTLPNLPPDADEYTRDLDRRLREILSRVAVTVEPLLRYKTDGQLLTANDEQLSGVEWASASSGIVVKDEGTTASATGTVLDFVGAGVTVTGTASTATITISGGGDIWRGKRITTVVPVPASTTLTTLGDALVALGTASGPALATTNLLSSTPRYVSTSAAAANSQCGLTGSAIYWRGNAAGLGGFRFEMDFGVVTTQTTMRVCAGLAYNGGFSVNLGTGDPSAATDCVFMGADAADTNMQIMHNDNAGTCTKIDLGASFPKTNNVMYRVVFTAAANGSSIDYSVTRLDSAATATGTISTNLPTSTVFMGLHCKFGNASTASAVAGAFFRYIGEHGTTT